PVSRITGSLLSYRGVVCYRESCWQKCQAGLSHRKPRKRQICAHRHRSGYDEALTDSNPSGWSMVTSPVREHTDDMLRMWKNRTHRQRFSIKAIGAPPCSGEQ
ncbi:unnamed protein product, partial [Linum tenue]